MKAKTQFLKMYYKHLYWIIPLSLLSTGLFIYLINTRQNEYQTDLIIRNIENNLITINSEITPIDINFNSDGTLMCLEGETIKYYIMYHLSTPWNISTATILQTSQNRCEW